MKLTTQRLKKLIREELEKKKKEEQMDENLKGLAMGVIAGLASLTAAYNIASTDTTSPETREVAQEIRDMSAEDIKARLRKFEQDYPGFENIREQTIDGIAKDLDTMSEDEIIRKMKDPYFKLALKKAQKEIKKAQKEVKESKRRS